MKKSTRTVAILGLAASMTLSSCIGPFKLTNQVLDWNKGVSNSKFVNELLFLGMHIVPIYPLSIVADGLLFNSIEFWSGSNPIASNKIQEVKGENGETYLVKRTGNGYKIYSEGKKESVSLNFDEQTQTWSMASKDKESKLFSFIGDNMVKLYLEDGSTIEMELSEEGLASLHNSVLEQM